MDLNTQQEVHLSHYWNVIRKRWKVAAAIMVVVMTGAFIAGYLSKPLYQAKIQIEIERENQMVTVEDLFGIAASDQEFLQTQYVLLKSRGLAMRVIDDHKLLSDPEFYPPGIAGKTPQEVAQITEGMAGALVGGITVTPVRNTSLVDISYVGTSPRLTQKIANAWGESFIRMNVAKKLRSVQQANEFLSEQIASVQQELEQSRQELQRYGQSKGIVSSSEGSDDITMQKLQQLAADVTTAQNDLFQKQATYQSVRRTSPAALAQDDPHVQRLTDELNALQRKQSEQRAQFLEGHPVMRGLAEQIEKTRGQREQAIRTAAEKDIEEARAAMEAASASVSSVRSAYESQKGDAQKMNVDASRFVDLRIAVETKQGLLTTLQKQLNEAEVTARLRGSASSNIHVIESALYPGGRFNLSMKKNLQSALPLGLIMGLAAIFFLEYMDRSIKSPEDLERMTRFASLGVIPAAGSITKQYGFGYGYGRSSGPLRAVETPNDKATGIELIPHTDARSPISEAYRAFRTSLLLASASSPKVIVITSSFAREGKTTTSANLATVLAQMGKPVAAGRRRPSPSASAEGLQGKDEPRPGELPRREHPPGRHHPAHRGAESLGHPFRSHAAEPLGAARIRSHEARHRRDPRQVRVRDLRFAARSRGHRRGGSGRERRRRGALRSRRTYAARSRPALGRAFAPGQHPRARRDPQQPRPAPVRLHVQEELLRLLLGRG